MGVRASGAGAYLDPEKYLKQRPGASATAQEAMTLHVFGVLCKVCASTCTTFEASGSRNSEAQGVLEPEASNVGLRKTLLGVCVCLLPDFQGAPSAELYDPRTQEP